MKKRNNSYLTNERFYKILNNSMILGYFLFIFNVIFCNFFLKFFNGMEILAWVLGTFGCAITYIIIFYIAKANISKNIKREYDYSEMLVNTWLSTAYYVEVFPLIEEICDSHESNKFYAIINNSDGLVDIYKVCNENMKLYTRICKRLFTTFYSLKELVQGGVI